MPKFRKFVKLSFWQRSPLIRKKSDFFAQRRRRRRPSQKVYSLKKTKKRDYQPNLVHLFFFRYLTRQLLVCIWIFKNCKFYLIEMYTTHVLTMLKLTLNCIFEIWYWCPIFFNSEFILSIMLFGTFHTLTYYKRHGLVSTLFTINQIPQGSYDKLGRILHAFLSPCWWKVQMENIFITFYYEFRTFVVKLGVLYVLYVRILLLLVDREK